MTKYNSFYNCCTVGYHCRHCETDVVAPLAGSDQFMSLLGSISVRLEGQSPKFWGHATHRRRWSGHVSLSQSGLSRDLLPPFDKQANTGSGQGTQAIYGPCWPPNHIKNAILPVPSTFVLSWLRQGPHLTWKKSLPSASGLGNQTSHGTVSRAMWVWSMSAFKSSGGWCHKTLHLDLQRGGIKLSTCPHNWSKPESACTQQTMLRSLHIFWIIMLVAITLIMILITQT